jgi:hypothetical protein
MAGVRRALIVANGEYDNAGLQRLGSPAADADALAGVLSDRNISDFDVRVVRNETAHVVQAEIEDLCAEGRPDDVLLLHFSCHGLKDDSGSLYFAARNTRPDRLGSTAVPAHFVQQCIRQSRSRSVVLLLDCCYGGAFGQGVAVRASGDANVLDNFRGGRGRAVITASNSIEYAFEGARLAEGQPAQPSVFTSALVEGLRTGEADRDEDGWIALGELYEYLFDRVRERNPKQTPSRDIEMQGELYLAKSRRRRIKPSPIPADLAAAIAAENQFTRLGAVAELRRRLASDNLPVAMGAFQALKTMVATDIQHIAAAASDALGFAVVRVDVASVRLSAAPGEVASASLRVVGPPVAREVRFDPSHAWIRAAEVAGGAELSVTAGEPGTRRGKVVVSGPTGDVVVEVEIEAVPEVVAEPEPQVAPEPVAGEPAAAVAGKTVADPVAAEPSAGAVESATVAGKPAAAAEPRPAASATKATAEPVGKLEAEGTAGPEATPRSERAAAAPQPEAPAAAAVRKPDSEKPEPPLVTVEAGRRWAALLGIGGGLLALAGLTMYYRHGSYTLAEYRPGMEIYVGIVSASALLGGVLALLPRAKTWLGPALLLGAGTAASFGALRFAGDLTTLSQDNADPELNSGFTCALVAHLALVLAALCAGAALRRDPSVGMVFRRVRGWPAWAAVAAGVVTAAGLTLELAELATYHESDAGRAAAYFVLGALLAVVLPGLAVSLDPHRVGWAVLAAGTAGLAGVLAPTFTAVLDHSELYMTGQWIAAAGVGVLAVTAVVLALVRRNQPIERQP